MKKFLCLIICLLAFNGMAQTEQTGLFDVNDESIFGETTEQTFSGKPVVLIDREATSKPQVNKAEQLPLPDLGKETLNIPIKTFFGHDRTAAFINHTTDFFIIVQVLDNQTIRITEQIQFITTTDGEKFKRTLPTKLSDLNGKDIQLNPEILSLVQDSMPVPITLNKKETEVDIVYDKPLPKGVHRMILEYLVSNPFKANRSLAEIILPITGPNWGQMIERLIVLVMMPNKTHFYEKEFLFGTNVQKIPEGVKISEDTKGVLTLQNTRLLPAYADIRLHLVLDAKDLPTATKQQNLNLIIMGIFALILSVYVALSISVARLKKWKHPLKDSKRINPILWLYELEKSPSDIQKNLIKKLIPPVRLANLNSCWGKVFAFLRFNYEYVIGVILLILSVKYVALYYHINLSAIIYIFFFILSIIAIYLIDYYGTKVQMSHLLDILKRTLINEPQGLNLARREIPTYYQIAVCFGFNEIWEKRLVKNNPTYLDLNCFRKEK